MPNRKSPKIWEWWKIINASLTRLFQANRIYSYPKVPVDFSEILRQFGSSGL